MSMLVNIDQHFRGSLSPCVSQTAYERNSCSQHALEKKKKCRAHRPIRTCMAPRMTTQGIQHTDLPWVRPGLLY
ncbi:hypothetical protein FKM82_024746 [Ascaphus truei]